MGVLLCLLFASVLDVDILDWILFSLVLSSSLSSWNAPRQAKIGS
jgi:hypothetical protein